MELIPFFSTAVMIATVASIVLAIASYAAYKARGRRRPNRDFDPEELRKVVFFHRYDPGASRGATDRLVGGITGDSPR